MESLKIPSIVKEYSLRINAEGYKELAEIIAKLKKEKDEIEHAILSFGQGKKLLLN